MKLIAGLDQRLSPHTGYTRAHWDEVFQDLIKGALKYASPGKALITYPEKKGSMYDERCDGFEGFSRILWMVGPWLHHRTDGRIVLDGTTHDLVAYTRQGILQGTDPQGPEYWGPIRTRHQTIVEAASIAMYLFMTRHLIWDKFTDTEKKQVATWLQGIIEKEPYSDNWVLFKVVVNTVLKCFGQNYSQLEINQYLDYMVNFYAGNGWYSDGGGPCFEYYNAWTIHPYFLFWIWMDGGSRPELADLLRKRTREFLDNYKYFFAANGSHPAFGRSLLYRMAAVGIFPLAEFFDVSPLSPGQSRRIASGNLKYFVDKGAIRDHHMTMGFNDEYLPLPEFYSSSQSPYWGAKAFWAFLLPEDHPFWTCPEEPNEVERRSFIVPIPGAGLMVQGDQQSGQVNVYVNNSANWVTKKYSNFCYSSHFGFEITTRKNPATQLDTFNYESGFCPSLDGEYFIHRMFPVHIVTQDHFSASYAMPFKLDPNKPHAGNMDPATRVYTNLIVKDNFHIRVHYVVAAKNFTAFDGGWALGYDEGQPEIKSGEGWEYCKHGNKISFIQNLHGYNGQAPARGFGNNPAGNNMLHKNSVVPALKFSGGNIDGQLFVSLMAADFSGRTPAELSRLVSTCEVTGNLVHLVFPDGEELYTQIGAWHDIFVTLRGKKITGRVLCARVDARGRYHVVYHDGKLAEF